MINKLFCIFVALIMAGSAAYGAAGSKKASAKTAGKKVAAAEKADADIPVLTALEPVKNESEKNYAGTDRSSLNEAYNYYIDGKIDKAEGLLDKVLLSNPGYMEALELRNRILELKEKMHVFKINTADEYMLQSEAALRDGNFYEGLLFYKKAVGLVPDMNDSRTYSFIMADLKAQSLKYAPEDRNKFINSVEAFRDGNFKTARRILYSLSNKYDSLKFFRGLMDVSQITYSNDARTKPLYSKALRDFKAGMYESAGSFVGEALAMDPKNPEYVFLREQIALERR